MNGKRFDEGEDGTLRRELERLRAENAHLRSLLSLDERVSDGHASSWSPLLLPESSSVPPSVDAGSSNESKLALFRLLFGARADVHATRWENASTGKAGWSPATKGGWSNRRGPKDYLPLTDEALASHLSGRATLGIYPLMRGDTCELLACDFDKGTWALDALAYLDVCHQNGMPAALERSRSGNGGHVWVFFDGPVPATDARAMGAALLWRRGQAEELGHVPEYVFTTASGEMVHPHLLSQTFHRIGAAAGMSRIRFHDLRHTHATLLLKAGVPLKVVSERLGHSSPAFTMCVYQHVLPGMQREAADLFGRMVTVGFSPAQATNANPKVAVAPR